MTNDSDVPGNYHSSCNMDDHVYNFNDTMYRMALYSPPIDDTCQSPPRSTSPSMEECIEPPDLGPPIETECESPMKDSSYMPILRKETDIASQANIDKVKPDGKPSKQKRDRRTKSKRKTSPHKYTTESDNIYSFEESEDKSAYTLSSISNKTKRRRINEHSDQESANETKINIHNTSMKSSDTKSNNGNIIKKHTIDEETPQLQTQHKENLLHLESDKTKELIQAVEKVKEQSNSVSSASTLVSTSDTQPEASLKERTEQQESDAKSKEESKDDSPSSEEQKQTTAELTQSAEENSIKDKAKTVMAVELAKDLTFNSPAKSSQSVEKPSQLTKEQLVIDSIEVNSNEVKSTAIESTSHDSTELEVEVVLKNQTLPKEDNVPQNNENISQLDGTSDTQSISTYIYKPLTPVPSRVSVASLTTESISSVCCSKLSDIPDKIR